MKKLLFLNICLGLVLTISCKKNATAYTVSNWDTIKTLKNKDTLLVISRDTLYYSKMNCFLYESPRHFINSCNDKRYSKDSINVLTGYVYEQKRQKLLEATLIDYKKFIQMNNMKHGEPDWFPENPAKPKKK